MGELLQVGLGTPVDSLVGIEKISMPLNGALLWALDPQGRVRPVPQPRLTSTVSAVSTAVGVSQTLIAAQAFKAWHVRSIIVSGTVATIVQIIDNATTIYEFPIVANTPFVVPIQPDGEFALAINTALTIKNLAGATSVLTVTTRYSFPTTT